MSKDLKQKLKEAEALVASVRKQIEKSKELKPFDWEGVESFAVNKQGTVVHFPQPAGRGLFYKKTKEQAKAFAHRLRILSCINNLKESLGCDWEFKAGKVNYEIIFNEREQEWQPFSDLYCNTGSIHFESEKDAKKVAEYLNKHYPNGWRLA